jgi:hypothetical protein
MKVTAADTYAALVEKQFEEWLDSTFSKTALKGVELFEHKTPTGMTFKVRGITQEFLIQCGGSAASFLNPHVLSKAPAPDPVNDPKTAQEAFLKMTPEERNAGFARVSKAMRFMCVEPRIVLEPNDQANCIPADLITLADYNSLAELVGKAFTGGGAALGLKTFRKGRR